MATTTTYTMAQGKSSDDFKPLKQIVTTSDSTVNIELNCPIIELNLYDDTEVALVKPVVGVYIIKIKQMDTGKTVTWPLDVKWPAATAPTLSTSTGKIDIITLVYDGSKFYGTYTLDF